MVLVEYSDDGGSSWSEVNVDDFKIRRSNGRRRLGNTARLYLKKNSGITVHDLVRISIDGVKVFEGHSKNSGKYRENDSRQIYDLRGYEYSIIQEEVSVDLSNVAPYEVIQNILPTDFTLNYVDSGITIDKYDVSQTRKKIFKRMMDRVNYVMWFEADKTVHFEPRGNRGNLTTYDNTYSDVVKFEEDDRDTIINKVVLHGTYNNQNIEVSRNDTDSQTDYGIISKTYNAGYINSQSEAESLADNILQPNPLDTGVVEVIGQKYEPNNIVNYEVDLVDDDRGINSTLDVVEQIIKEKWMKVRLGQGVDIGIQESHRKEYSNEDKTGSGKEWSDVFDDGGKPEDGADQTKYHMDDVNYVGDTAPDNPKEGWLWYDDDTGALMRYNGDSWKFADASWGSVKDDGGKPEDSATVGGQFGINIDDENGSTVGDALSTSNHSNKVRNGSVHSVSGNSGYNNSGADADVQMTVECDVYDNVIKVQLVVNNDFVVDSKVLDGLDYDIVNEDIGLSGLVADGDSWELQVKDVRGSGTYSYGAVAHRYITRETR